MPTDYNPDDMLVGTVGFQIIRGMGAARGVTDVYEVRHAALNKRYVAKVVKRAYSDNREVCERFQRGARAHALIDAHPNIVSIVDLGTTRERPSVPYCILEHLEGETVRTLLTRKRTIDPLDALRIVMEVLEALAHAHDRGVVHRDCKPENVFLHLHRRGRQIIVIDWSDLKILTTPDELSTAAGILVGTRTYASPEQIEGGPITPQTDLWSVAVMLFELLTGRHPITEGCRTIAAMNAAILSREPTRLRAHLREAPSLLEELLMLAMSRDPRKRPFDATAFAHALEPIREHYRRIELRANDATVEEPSPSQRGPISFAAVASNATPSLEQSNVATPHGHDALERDTRSADPKLSLETPTEVTPRRNGPSR